MTLVLLVAALASPFGCGGGDEEAPLLPGQVPCSRESDCDDGNPCTFNFCQIAGDGRRFCSVPADVDNGREPPEAEDVEGDCMEEVCIDGQVTMQPANDPPEDPTDDCTVPTCTEGTVGEGPAEAGSGCPLPDGGNGVCDGMGTCSCAAASPGADHFVDPVNGTDDAANGGGGGACAYASLDFALTQATGLIILAPGEYTTANTTFPITLSGNQFLRCRRDDMDQQGRIAGSGDAGGQAVTFVFAGDRNGFDDCEVDGGGTADALVLVSSVAPEDSHEIDDSDLHGAAGDGVVVTATGSNLLLTQNTIRDNGGRGLAFDALEPDGQLNENTFSGNTTDVVCADAAAGVSGSDNSLTTCMTCGDCPF